MSQIKDSGASRSQLYAKNPRIDLNTVNAYEKLERQLNKLGVEVKPEYRIEPPLGTYRTASQIHRG